MGEFLGTSAGAALTGHHDAVEGYTPATYGDSIAEIYDSLYEAERMDPSPAVEFLAELAAGRRALELGIGTGRVAIPLREAGVEVHGVDASTAMVTKLRQKPGGANIPVTIGDFAELPVDETFGLIYIPFTTFFALDSQEQQLGCMQSIASHLDAGGHFVLDAFVPDLSRYGVSNQAITNVDVGLGRVMIDAMHHDPIAQAIEGHHILTTEQGTKLYPLRVRYCWPSELDLMAQLAGLHMQARFGWYDKSPFTAQSVRHVSVYAKP